MTESEKRLIEKLKQMSAGEDFVLFQKRTTKTNKVILGVKAPQVRQVAKQLSVTNFDWVFDELSNNVFEIVLIKGFLAAKIADFSRATQIIDKLADCFDSWAETDMIVPNLAFVKNNPNKAFGYFEKLTKSSKEFVSRFGIVGLMKYFLDEQHCWQVIDIISRIKLLDYYVEMAKSWLVSELLIKSKENSPEIMEKIISNYNFSEFVIKKSIQKANESFRLSPQTKQQLKNLNK